MDIKKILRWPALPSLILFIVFVIINSLISSRFMSVSAWSGFFQTTIPIIIISMGQAVVILGGGIDLSVGSTVAVVNVIMATTSSFEGSIFKPILLSMAAALAIGVCNGFLVSKLRINALLATFSVSFIGNGIALTILPIPGGQVPALLSDFYYYDVFGFITAGFVYVLFVYAVWSFWRLSPFGVQLYAMGRDKNKAFFSKVNVAKVQFMTFLFSGFAAGVAGIAASSNFCAGDPRIGTAMTLNSVAACVIGGLSLSGGSGSVAGSIFGALFLYLILISVMALRIPAYYQDLVSGCIVLLGILLAVFLRKRGKSSIAY